METLIAWLEQVEMTARDLYADAAGSIEAEPALMQLLLQLSQDEAQHCDMMAAARSFLAQLDTHPPSAIALDDELRRRVEGPLGACRLALGEGNPSADAIVDAIIQAEFSEWNHVFVYAIDSLRGYGRDFRNGAAAMQKHEGRIRTYLEDAGDEVRLERLELLPTVWESRILVIDDDIGLRRLMPAVLRRIGQVHTAGNGREALEMLSTQYYDAILCDVEMPVMGGIEFFKEASQTRPDLASSILFWSGGMNDDVAEFFRIQELEITIKPASMSMIQARMTQIIKDSAH